MSLSELLDRTFTIYRNHFWLFCGLMALPEVAIVLCQLASLLWFPMRVVAPATANPSDPFAALAAMKSNFASLFVVGLATIICKAFSFGAVTLAVSELVLGRATSIRESYRRVRSRVLGLFGLILLLTFIGFLSVFAAVFVGVALGVLLGTGITGAAGGAAGGKVLTVIIVFILTMAGVVGGASLAIWLLMRFAVSIPVFLLEKTGVADSLSRSGTLTRGHRWRIFGAVMIMYIVAVAVQTLFTLPFVILIAINAAKGLLPLWLQVGSSVAGAVGSTLAGPLLMIALALVYYDVRIRKEAFDLETMMAGLGPAAPDVQTAPPPAGPAMGLP